MQALFHHKVDDILVVVLNTQAKTANLTTPTIQTSLAQPNIPLKIDFYCSAWRVHSQLTPINYAKFFLALGCTPCHAYVQRTR